MSALSQLPNVGTVLEDHLIAIGVKTPEQLKEMGSREAFLRIKIQRDSGACLNMLCGIQGAIEGIRWKYLSDKTKQELRAFYNSL